ncbi:hypothetical protein RUMOBE_03895 [Blautia obeum ATCC 29174]|uniref:Uncharacterized protein n=1 Tax=Blautia obeum ATCC 29174 TaxID=411459 RepID=A5ZXY9_9FIRM|nr:hypothetical protein RUMOBE_03895 [Blautia obeum ATCC 29174]
MVKMVLALTARTIYSSYNPATRNPIATARYANRIRYAM